MIFERRNLRAKQRERLMNAIIWESSNRETIKIQYSYKRSTLQRSSFPRGPHPSRFRSWTVQRTSPASSSIFFFITIRANTIFCSNLSLPLRGLMKRPTWIPYAHGSPAESRVSWDSSTVNATERNLIFYFVPCYTIAVLDWSAILRLSNYLPRTRSKYLRNIVSNRIHPSSPPMLYRQVDRLFRNVDEELDRGG